ncbi:MAG: hypothetical protein ABEJ42_08870 [Halobacteriaceae archaeon]
MSDSDTPVAGTARDAPEFASIDVDDETLIYQRGAPDRWIRSSTVVGVEAMA